MANTTEKKKTTTTKKSTTKPTESKVEVSAKNTSVDQEKVALQAQVEAQAAEMAKMQAQMQALMAMVGNVTASTKVETPKKNRMIRFVNLKNATISLKGTSFWTIEGRYNYRDFPEQEARAIVVNMASFLRKGSVYIDDAEFVHDNDLDGVYETLLSDTDLKTLLDRSVTDVIETYKSVNDNQKEVIIDLILDDRKAGKEIDYNILATLGGLCGKDLIHPDGEDNDE